MTRPLISVVIPTKSRSHLLQNALRSVVDQARQFDCEVVVSDNWSVDNTRAVVDDFCSYGVRVVSPPHPMSMADHWEFAVDQASGEYITYLCDDDALAPGAVSQAVNDIGLTRAPVIVHGCVQYAGLSAPDKMRRNSLAVGKFNGGYQTKSAEMTRTQMTACRCHMALPLMLNSFCHRDVIAQGKERAGGIFVYSPDYSFALTVLTLVDSWVFVDRPLRLMGAFCESTGIATIQNRGEATTTFAKEHGTKDLYPHVPLRLNLVTNHIANTYLDVKSRCRHALSDFEIDWVEYFVGCWEDICRLRDNGVDVSRDIDEFHSVLGSEVSHVRDEVTKRGRSVSGAIRRRLRWVAYHSRLLFKLGMRVQEGGWAYWGDDCGFGDICEASRFVGALSSRNNALSGAT